MQDDGLRSSCFAGSASARSTIARSTRISSASRPDYTVRVSRRLLDDEDGPMLELLKAFHRKAIELPARRAWQPDRERLAARFERFNAAAG